MNDRENSGEEATRRRGEAADPATTDPVEAAVASYLDFLDGLAERPALDQLAEDDRLRAIAVINSLLAGRGIELHGSTPSVEELLAGTDLEPMLEAHRHASSDHPPEAGHGGGADRETEPAHASRPIDGGWTRIDRIEHALRGADSRVRVRAEPHKLLGPAVTAVYLDLRAVFFPVNAPTPEIGEHTQVVLSRLLSDDTELDYLGAVADDSEDLLTQLLSAADLGSAAVTPSDDVQLLWPPVLPLPLALRSMLELAAPSWEPFTFDTTNREPLQLTDVASNAANRVLTREVARRYQGDKGRAYKSFANSEADFAFLIVKLATSEASDAAVADALELIVRDAA